MTNYLLFFKTGHQIKIKKKNRGKFTDYCGGTVTEECIQKGKHSSNPTTRKRANFAWVARHKFKHQTGGELINSTTNKSKSLYSRAIVKDPENKNITKYLKDTPLVYIPKEGDKTSVQQSTNPYDLSGYVLFPAVAEAVLAAQSDKPKTFKDRSEFVSSLSAAYKSAGFSDDLVKLLVAQDALESAWGLKVVGDYNYGNIKKGSSWTGKTKSAMDDEKSPSHFRSYNNHLEYVADKVNLLLNTYGITKADTVEQAIAKLNGQNTGKYKYATSPSYTNSLLSVYKSI